MEDVAEMLDFAKRSLRDNLPTVYQYSRDLKYTASSLLFRNSVVEHDYCGHRLKIHIRDSTARSWYDRDWNRLTELDLLRQHGLHDGAVVFDLGAHQNLVAMLLAKEIEPGGRVIAVEGSKHNVRVGRLNAELNGITNLTTVHAVVGANEGRLAFSQSYNGEVIPGKQPALHFLQAVTIDSMAREHGCPDIVFVDIEGYEMEAIGGAAETLHRLTTWCIEVHGDATLAKFGTSNQAVADIFAHGYRRYFRDEDEGVFRAVSEAEAVPRTRFWLVAAPVGAL
jgi:FkbM family methyltransferase